MDHPESIPQSPLEPGRDEPTVVDPGLYQFPPDGSPAGLADGTDHAVRIDGRSVRVDPPAGIDNQKTVVSRRPPQSTVWASSPSAELGALLEGKQLGHFTLEQFVGGGGMGAVFRGRDNQLGRTVAVKVLSRDHGADPEMLRRFRNEAQSAARLDHENIARVFFVGEDDGWNYIVFEFIEGTNLRELVERRGPLPLEDAIDYMMQVAEALAHAAQRDVVHRDIKPSNVLITADGRAKLVDMGLARLHQMEAGQSDLTASGVTLGTFDYISPEQASDPRRADVRSDLYSLGCTLFFTLTGRPPFPQGTVLQKLLAHSGEPPPDPRSIRADLPEELVRILNRLLAKRPEQRYAQPGELVRELLVLRERLGLGDGSGQAWLAQGPLTWRERALAWGAPLAIMLLALLTMNLYWSRSGSGLDRPPEFQRPQRVAASAATAQDALKAGGSQHEAPRPTSSNDQTAPVGASKATSPGEPPASGAGNRTAVDASSGNGGNQSGSGTPASEDEPRQPRPAVDPPPEEPSSGTSGTSGSTNPATGNSASPSVEKPAPVTSAGSDDEGSDDEGGDDEGSSATPAAPKPLETPPAVNVIRRIVVGDASKLGDLGPDVRMYPTLHAAFASDEFAQLLADVSTIEIAPGLPVIESPLRIKLPPGADLTLRGMLPEGASPALPKLRFSLAANQYAPASAAAIDMSGADLTLENLHVEVTVDESASAEEISLFRLAVDEETHVELSRCILTLKPSTGEHQPRAAFFDVLPPAAGTAMMGGMPSVLPIDLKDCIVRGEAVLVRMRRSLPLDLVWTNGLFISNQRMLLAEGAKESFERSPGVIRLTLRSVTSATDEGLCLLRSTADQPHQLPLELESHECIFVVRSASSLVEHDGVGDAEKYGQTLSIMGSKNFYEGVDVFWRLYVDNIQHKEWGWSDWSKRLMPDGSAMMRSFVDRVIWQRPRSDVGEVPVHRQGVDDYLLEAKETNDPFRQKAGFDPALLPALVRIKPPAILEPPLPLPAAAIAPADDSL